MALSSSVQRTAFTICSTALAFASSPEATAFPVTLLKHLIFGLLKVIFSSSEAKAVAAFSINGEWKGPATFNTTTRFAPASLQRFSARTRPFAVPETTVCLGLFKFVGKTASSFETSPYGAKVF